MAGHYICLVFSCSLVLRPLQVEGSGRLIFLVHLTLCSTAVKCAVNLCYLQKIANNGPIEKHWSSYNAWYAGVNWGGWKCGIAEDKNCPVKFKLFHQSSSIPCIFPRDSAVNQPGRTGGHQVTIDTF